MLPSSHQVQTRFPPPASPELLATAFSEFISASARLELSYRDLQTEVQQLSRELAERNLALEGTLNENRAMRESLEQILDSMPCGVLVLEADGTIRLANPEAARLLSMSAGDLRSLAAVQARHGIDLLLGQSVLIDEALEHELALTLPTGERWLSVRRRTLHTAAPTTHARGAAVLTLRDVTARRRMETERDAARSSVALAEVSAMLAHEIRNPLASMELFAGLLAEGPATHDHAFAAAQHAEWVSHLRAGIRSLSGTVNNVLTLHGGTPPPLEQLHLREELALAIDFLTPLARQAQVSLSLAPPATTAASTPTHIRANRNALQQIILNLCSNSLRHTTAGGWVRLSIEHRSAPATKPSSPRKRNTTRKAAADPSRIAIHVADNGCGIPAESIPHLFHGRFSGSGSSPGLGLTVCARLMRQHGGSISVHSQPGLGSTFTLEFPAR